MSDPRAECWEAATECMAEADKVLARLKFNPHTHTAAEIPAAAVLYMQRAQILATLATAPIDVVQSQAISVMVKDQARELSRQRANDIMTRHQVSKPRPS